MTIDQDGNIAFWVSSGGSPTGDGSQQDPFDSIATAQAAVRAILQAGPLTTDVVVNVEGGTYRLDQPLSFDASDSGNNGHVVHYRAVAGEHPELSGAVPITNWTSATPVGITLAPGAQLWQADVAPGLVSQQLYIDGNRATLAETNAPNDSYPQGFRPTYYDSAGLSGIQYYVNSSNSPNWNNPASWTNVSGIEAVVWDQWKEIEVPLSSVEAPPISSGTSLNPDVVPTSSVGMIELQDPAWTNANLIRGLPTGTVTTNTSVIQLDGALAAPQIQVGMVVTDVVSGQDVPLGTVTSVDTTDNQITVDLPLLSAGTPVTLSIVDLTIGTVSSETTSDTVIALDSTTLQKIQAGMIVTGVVSGMDIPLGTVTSVDSGAEQITVSQTMVGSSSLPALVGSSVALGVIDPSTGEQVVGQQVMGQPNEWSFFRVTQFLNAYQFLDQPGEWYLDQSTNKLYLVTSAGDDPNNHDIELPVQQQLLDANGASNLSFEGLTFDYATWMGPASSNGYVADQSGFHISGSDPLNGPNQIGHFQDVTRTPGAVSVDYGSGITFSGDVFSHLGAVGLDFVSGAQDNTVTSNTFLDTSGAAIQLGGVNAQDARPTSDSGISRDNVINGNVIDGAGVEFVDAPGIMVGYAQNTDITNNSISNTAWSGIALGWGWGLRDQWIVYDPSLGQYLDMGSFPGLDGATPAMWGINDTPTVMGGNEIVGNTITNFLQKGWDGGAIYTTGFQDGNYLADLGTSGTLIADNVAYDKTPSGGGNVFYTDGGSRFLEITNNVLFGNPTGKINFGVPFAVSDGLNANNPLALLPLANSLDYGSDIGGCFTYGDILYLENHWENLWTANPFSQNPSQWPANPLYFDPGKHGTSSDPLQDVAALPGAPYPTGLQFVSNTQITTIGSLPVQSPTAQLEALYIGWFGRAAGAAEFQANMETVLTSLLAGSSLVDAMLSVSDSFATSPEDAPYAALAALTPPISSPTPEEIALTNSFIDQTYSNLFGRTATTAEEDSWRQVFFAGGAPFSALVYEIAQTAGGNDIVAENSKIDAASYFTTAMDEAHHVPSLSEMQAAVSGVVDQTTELASQVATNTLVSASHAQISYDSILSPGTFITGVRADLDGAVILTGSEATSGGDTQAFLYQGPLDNTALGTVYLLTPQLLGETVETSTFYGPDTSIFDPALGEGVVRAVGSYQYAESPAHEINHGMLYEGLPDGIGLWFQIDVPSDGTNVVNGIVLSGTVEDTILHSTQGDLIVGNYDMYGPGGTLIRANGVIYNIVTRQFTLMQINGSLDNFTSLYGIWQNGIGGSSYTITGGTRDEHGINAGFLEDYDSSTGVFSNLTYYHAFDQPGLVTHFENITTVPGGFDLVATTDNGPAFAFVPVNPDGSFGSATWVPVNLPGSDLLTGNIAYQNIIGGVYNTSASSGGVASYLGTVDLSFVDSSGGLIMPVGSHNFVYALTVSGSVGDNISGSTSAGNMLGGSIGNDIIVGTQNTSAADTIFTGGGADTIMLAASHTASDRIELYAANGLNDIANLSAGGVAPSVSASIVDAGDTPQLGWWGQATAQSGGPVSDNSTNAGVAAGTSQDLSTVVNFAAGDTIDVALDAFSGLLRNLGNGNAPSLGTANFSNLVAPGGAVTVENADVLLIDNPIGFINAADVALTLSLDPITFAATQSGTYNHYIVAYQDLGGDVRIADMDIHLGSASSSFDSTAGGATLSISDMLVLSGVSLASLQEGNITFLQGGGLDVVSGQTLIVSGGQSSSGLDVQSSGTLEVESGGTVTSATVSSGGYQEMTLSGVATGTTVLGGGIEVVSSGGSATHTTVSSGGTLELAGGASATSTTFLAGATFEIVSGYSVSGLGVSRGLTLEVGTGATATATTVSSGAIETVSGGAASGAHVQGGGAVLVLAGGTTSGDALVGSGSTLLARETVSSGGVASGTILSNTGLLTVSSGGLAVGAVVSNNPIGSSGGVLVLSGGTASSVTLSSGADETLSGGTASGTVVSLGGREAAFAGGVTQAAVVSIDGLEIVSAGGLALGTVLSLGGHEIVSSGGIGSGATVLSSGGLTVLKGGVASAATISNGGQEVVSSGGINRQAMVSTGGEEIVSNGGAASGTSVLSGGAEIVSSGGIATGVAIVGGSQTVLRGGTANATVVSTGMEVVAGSAAGTVVEAGGSAVVSSGGTANAMVLNGGSATVMSGGVISGATISSGTLEIQSGGGVQSSTITFAGSGSLVLDDTKFRGKIAGLDSPAETVDLTTVNIATASLGYTGNTLSGTLTVTDGTHTARLAILGQYTATSFHLAGDGNGGTLVFDPPVDSSGHLAQPGHA